MSSLLLMVETPSLHHRVHRNMAQSLCPYGFQRIGDGIKCVKLTDIRVSLRRV